METLESRPRPMSGIQENVLFDEMVLYVPGEEKAVSLNRSARMVWDL